MFRSVNEEIDDDSGRVAPKAYVCECADLGCVATIRLVPVEYRAVRSSPRRFLVAPGHERAELEDVVERHEAYLVVEKR